MKAKFSTAILVFMTWALVPAESFAHEYPSTDTWSSAAQRADFVLSAPSANLKYDLNLRAETCGDPRAWIGRTFAAAVREFTVVWTGAQSLPTQPGVASNPVSGFPAAFLVLEMEATQGPGCP
ncbi:MAG: hypothetical protein IT380_17535 [Myxococcales bacterium]|nr:hypothetical protein [Myxococcales bacterium]